ncbi:class I SAM-dependent methyltransferase, partial [Singulisphaera rosea]
EMIARARARCQAFGDRAGFERLSIYDPTLNGPYDAAISRYVLHHVTDPLAFVSRQVELLRPGGILVLSDHTTDPDRLAAEQHQEIEKARDSTHTRNLTPGELVDLFAAAGLVEIRLVEEHFDLDFDEWFDRGTPSLPKEEVRVMMLEGPRARGFHAALQPDGRIRILCARAIVRGVKPSSTTT